MMLPKLFFSLLLLSLSTILWAQSPPRTVEEYEETYEKRIQQERLDGVYIPKDLADAFVQLNKAIDREGKQMFLSVDDTTAARKLYFSLGRWITYNWGFREGSRLSHYLRNIGISHPEDMASFIIVSYHRNLRRVPLDVKAQVEAIRKRRADERRERLLRGNIIHQETRKVSPADTTNKH